MRLRKFGESVPDKAVGTSQTNSREDLCTLTCSFSRPCIWTPSPDATLETNNVGEAWHHHTTHARSAPPAPRAPHLAGKHAQGMRELREQVHRFAAVVAGTRRKYPTHAHGPSISHQTMLNNSAARSGSGPGDDGNRGKTEVDKRRSGRPSGIGQIGSASGDHAAEHDAGNLDDAACSTDHHRGAEVGKQSATRSGKPNSKRQTSAVLAEHEAEHDASPFGDAAGLSPLRESVGRFAQQAARSSQLPSSWRSCSLGEVGDSAPTSTGQLSAASAQEKAADDQDTAISSDATSTPSDTSRRPWNGVWRRAMRRATHEAGCQVHRRRAWRSSSVVSTLSRPETTQDALLRQDHPTGWTIPRAAG